MKDMTDRECFELSEKKNSTCFKRYYSLIFVSNDTCGINLDRNLKLFRIIYKLFDCLDSVDLILQL